MREKKNMGRKKEIEMSRITWAIPGRERPIMDAQVSRGMPSPSRNKRKGIRNAAQSVGVSVEKSIPD